MTIPMRAGVIAITALALGIGLSGCGSDKTEGSATTSATESETTSSAAPTTTAQATGPAKTIVDYIKENNITETPVKRGEPGAPNINLPIPQGWEDAGARTPEWAYGAIVFADPAAAQDPATVIAILSKLTGDVDPAKILEYAPGEIQNLPDFEGPETGKPTTLSGFDATQIGGIYTRDGINRMIAQKTVVIPGQDGSIYVLQLNADGTEDQAIPLMDATQAIDDEATITP
ncbi:MAG: LpqN/LpqT family lipoprotein [Mycolicibacterium sp.]|uniref:LpqN/LpqT family lipoprotein n=1 Tax=Mycolicibacterium sp. TaxID=2320850 RepID=UPI003D138E09